MTEGRDDAPLRVLLSFAYYGQADLRALRRRLAMEAGRPVQVLADSGAFTMHTQGRPISLAAYSEWLGRNRRDLAHYAVLDVINDPGATSRNLALMEAVQLRPLPVFHGGSPWGVLESYCDSHPYVALGGLAAGADRAERLPWLGRAFTIAQRAGTALHGFAVSAWRELLDFPWYSVDASSWGQAHRYGTVPLFADGRWARVHAGDRAAYRQGDLLREHGLSPEQVADRGRWNYLDAAGASAVAWWRAQEWLRRRHGPVAGPGRPGLHLYLVDGSPPNLYAAARGIGAYHRRRRAAG